MLSAGSYLLGAAELAVVAVSLSFSAFCLRRRLLASWSGAPGRLVEVITAIALVTWISEVLGTFTLFYPGTLVAASVLLAAVVFWRTQSRDGSAEAQGAPSAGGGVGIEPPRGVAAHSAEYRRGVHRDRTRGQWAWSLITLAVIAVVVGHWAITAEHALEHGIFNFDSLWYHLPFSVDMVQSHSLTGMHHVDTVFTNWFYPQNSELLHAVGILLTGRDTLSLFINFGWLGVAFLAAWCVGEPYGRGHLTVIAAAVLLECHTLVVREPGAAKNDLAAAALLLAAIAILLNAWARRGAGALEHGSESNRKERGLPVGWPLAAAGLAVGLAAGTKVTVLAMAAALSLAILVLAPSSRRRAAVGWWFLPALLGGGFWYLRNLVVVGNPLPEIVHLGPISLPHPERLQIGRPDFTIAHYATATGVWRHYFIPGLHDAFGVLWPLVVFGTAASALLAIVRGRDRIVRAMGAVALLGMLAYLVTPLSAAGAEGEPLGFAINVRFIVPALLAGIVLLPLPRALEDPRRQWGLLGILLAVLLLTDRPDAALHDQARLFAAGFVVLAVLVPAALWLAWERGAGRALLAGGAVALAAAIVVIGYPLQRHYLQERFANQAAGESIPGMSLDSAYRWARHKQNTRIGLAGTTADFAGYGFYGTDLSNEVIYLGADGPHGAFNAIATCAAFRAALNAADLDYLVTSPFLNFLHPGRPISSPEARWLRGDRAVAPVLRSGPVTVWKVRGELTPATCGAANAPLREIPDTGAG